MLNLSELEFPLSRKTVLAFGKIKNQLRKLHNIISPFGASHPDLTREVIDDLAVMMPALDRVLAQLPVQAPIHLYWSPVRGQAGIARPGIDPVELTRRLWTFENTPDKILFTSATLTTKQGDGLMDDFSAEIGLSRDRMLNVMTGRVSPDEFGKMSFIVTHPAFTPLPVVRHEEDTDGMPELNPHHAKLALQVIREALLRGGRTLVLVPSYRDIALYRLLIADGAIADVADRIIFDNRREKRMIRQRFVNTPDTALISPGSWVGMDMPGMITNLVIPRLPIPPIDNASTTTFEQFLRANDVSDAIIKGRRFAAALGHTRRKITQGIGRGIRAHDDDVTVWICDPRWPAPSGCVSPNRRTWSAGLREAIPERFLPMLARADIFHPGLEPIVAAQVAEPVRSRRSLSVF